MFHLTGSAPAGSRGAIGVPFPGSHTTGILYGVDGDGKVVRADAWGKYWISDVDGGDFEVVLVGN